MFPNVSGADLGCDGFLSTTCRAESAMQTVTSMKLKESSRALPTNPTVEN